MELTERNLCSFEIIKPPATADTGTGIVPGRIETPAPTREWRLVTRNYVGG